MSAAPKRRAAAVKPTKLQALDLIRSPVITEKATMGLEHDQVTFRVSMSASKPAIKHAVEDLFRVKVLTVNTITRKGKRKRFRGIIGRRPDYKKAIVRLAEGHRIDLATGI